MEKTGVLHHLVDKGARILIKYNEHVFSVQQERGMTDEDREKFDWRSARLTNITLKARGELVRAHQERRSPEGGGAREETERGEGDDGDGGLIERNRK